LRCVILFFPSHSSSNPVNVFNPVISYGKQQSHETEILKEKGSYSYSVGPQLQTSKIR
jgi:hypothetical protein